MGLLDHRRTWTYELTASPADCINAFSWAFNRGGSLLTKARWRLHTSSNGATATYEGRRGLGAVGGILIRTAAQEADTAIGSRVSFTVERTDGSTTLCSMALTSSGSSGLGGLLGATSDARFIRPYMQAVAKEMRRLDANARIQST